MGAVSKSQHNIAMASSQDESESKYKVPQLLHPELLSLEDIRRILKDRCVTVSGMHSMDKEHLVAVLHRVSVPIPQRDCFRNAHPTRRITFNSNGNNKALLHRSERFSSTTNKRPSIDDNKKIIKLKRTSEPCHEEDNQKVDSLKRLNIADKDNTKTQKTGSSTADTLIEESPASKKSRVKISWP